MIVIPSATSDAGLSASQLAGGPAPKSHCKVSLLIPHLKPIVIDVVYQERHSERRFACRKFIGKCSHDLASKLDHARDGRDLG